MDWILYPQIHRLTPNPQCDDIRRWGIWEVIRSWGRSPQGRIGVLTKETPEPLAPSTMWEPSEKKTVSEPGGKLSPDTESWPWTCRLQTVRNECLLFINHPVCGGCVIAAQTDRDTVRRSCVWLGAAPQPLNEFGTKHLAHWARRMTFLLSLMLPYSLRIRLPHPGLSLGCFILQTATLRHILKAIAGQLHALWCHQCPQPAQGWWILTFSDKRGWAPPHSSLEGESACQEMRPRGEGKPQLLLPHLPRVFLRVALRQKGFERNS